MKPNKAEYSCNPGYTLKGNATRLCTSDGQWTPSQPVCKGRKISLNTPEHNK